MAPLLSGDTPVGGNGPAGLDRRPAQTPGRRRAGAAQRSLALLVCLGCLALLGVAAWLRPAPEGHGTHEQLGLPPCAWAQALGKPCMTCGMTTAFALAAHGDLVGSARVQPFGFVLALMVAATAWGAGHVAATGSMLGEAAMRLLTPRMLWALVGLLLAAWAYKVATWEG